MNSRAYLRVVRKEAQLRTPQPAVKYHSATHPMKNDKLRATSFEDSPPSFATHQMVGLVCLPSDQWPWNHRVKQQLPRSRLRVWGMIQRLIQHSFDSRLNVMSCLLLGRYRNPSNPLAYLVPVILSQSQKCMTTTPKVYAPDILRRARLAHRLVNVVRQHPLCLFASWEIDIARSGQPVQTRHQNVEIAQYLSDLRFWDGDGQSTTAYLGSELKGEDFRAGHTVE